MTHCKACNTPLEDGRRTCPNCGRSASSFVLTSAQASGRSAKPQRKLPLGPSSLSEPVDLVLEEVAPPSAEADDDRSQRVAEAHAATSGEALFTMQPAQLRALVAERPERLEPGLAVLRDEEGTEIGVGYATPVGEIDLLGRDDAGALVVVMVAERGSEKDLVSEVLRRIGWARKHRAEPGQEVRGIVLLDPGCEGLDYAAAAMADTVSFKTFRLTLRFEDVEL
jgi:uncharacterized Zn finger protein (UPF0148 family)